MNEVDPSDADETDRPDPEDEFVKTIDRKEKRRLRAEQREPLSAWFGLGMFGLVGWAVVVPILLGVGTGWWIDRTWPGGYSWTLILMLAGVFLGAINAWQWIDREYKQIEDETREEPDDE